MPRRGRPAGVAPKVAEVAERLAERLRAGFYLTAALPSETALADEMGVSYLTARRAVARLVELGLLAREPHGRLALGGAGAGAGAERRVLQVAFATPTWTSFDVLRWHRALAEAVASPLLADLGVNLRPATVGGWDDPALAALLARADGVVLYPGSWDPAPAPAVLARARARVLAVDRDCSGLGLPSLHPTPPEGVDRLLDHLRDRGRRRIAAVASHPDEPVIAARLARWRAWAAAHGMEPVVLAAERGPLAALLRTAGAPDALIAMTMPSALTAIRAARDAGRAVPADCAVCVVNDEGLGETLVPSVTALAAFDPVPALARALAWMAGATAAWDGPLCLRPQPPAVAIREST